MKRSKETRRPWLSTMLNTSARPRVLPGAHARPHVTPLPPFPSMAAGEFTDRPNNTSPPCHTRRAAADTPGASHPASSGSSRDDPAGHRQLHELLPWHSAAPRAGRVARPRSFRFRPLRVASQPPGPVGRQFRTGRGIVTTRFVSPLGAWRFLIGQSDSALPLSASDWMPTPAATGLTGFDLGPSMTVISSSLSLLAHRDLPLVPRHPPSALDPREIRRWLMAVVPSASRKA